ncbi:MAG: hypothetical protein IPP22_14995 [Nitrosomonas sp.]|nr:hypothetical protein [Nitrosomonas sp.]
MYCLRTDMMDWDAEKLWRTYIMLTDLGCISQPEIRIRHAPRLPSNDPTWKVTCGSHCLPITWCASHPFALKAADIHDSWDTLRQRMRSHMRVTTTMRTKDNKTLHSQNCSP